MLSKNFLLLYKCTVQYSIQKYISHYLLQNPIHSMHVKIFYYTHLYATCTRTVCVRVLVYGTEENVRLCMFVVKSSHFASSHNYLRREQSLKALEMSARHMSRRPARKLGRMST